MKLTKLHLHSNDLTGELSFPRVTLWIVPRHELHCCLFVAYFFLTNVGRFWSVLTCSTHTFDISRACECVRWLIEQRGAALIIVDDVDVIRGLHISLPHVGACWSTFKHEGILFSNECQNALIYDPRCPCAWLTGLIPTELGTLSDLQELSLAENELSGELALSIDLSRRPIIYECGRQRYWQDTIFGDGKAKWQ